MENKSTKGMLVLLATMLNLAACSGQTQQKKNLLTDAPQAVTDTPKVEVRVNKKYDPNGNLVAYDSTYSSIYEGRAIDPAFMDSVFQDFKPRFNLRYPFLNDPGFDDLFFQDSLLHHDFFHDDFFQRRMDLNSTYMERMMAEMDSLKNSMLGGTKDK